MFDYYMELINKPKYMLSTSEQLFVDIFPFLIIGIICIVIVVIAFVVDIVKKK